MMKSLERIEWKNSFLSGSQEEDKDRKELLLAYNEFVKSVNMYSQTKDFRDYVSSITIQTKQYFKKLKKGEFLCDSCGKEFGISGAGYIGPRNRRDMFCHPFMDLAHVCSDCENKNRENP